MKQMEIEYEASIAKLEQKAKEGILVREEKLKELKNEKRAISLELKQVQTELSNIKEEYKEKTKQYQELSEMSKQGERLLTK